jgi:hypothetical protein
LPAFCATQKQVPVNDPQALALAVQSIALLKGGVSVTDAVLSGNATWIAGSTNETGAAKLELSGSQLSRLDLYFATASRSEIRNDSAGFPDGDWVDAAGTRYQMAADQCWTPAAWYSPLAWLQTASGVDGVLSYVGSETYNGASVDHLHVYRAISAQSDFASKLLQRLTAFDLYLDSKSHLPLAVGLNAHPDDNAAADIPAEIRFTNYQVVNGVQVPYRIQRFLQNTLYLDITLTGAAINSGVVGSDFELQGAGR